ncbi:MAG TPA: hypothetical protein VFA12_20700 [Stellaceae bacterium]|nr:hypothetical protein [Stellaceae bacterium]
MARLPAPGEDIELWLHREQMDGRDRVRALLLELGRPDLVVELEQRYRDIELGLDGARSTWHSISAAQRRALKAAAEHGGRLERVGKQYRHRDRHQPYRPIYVATLRNLCARDLTAWDGGAFDPEGAVVVTERGLFVLRHGPHSVEGGRG